MPELSEAQVAAVMAAILEITGSKDLQELSSRGEATMEQWRELTTSPESHGQTTKNRNSTRDLDAMGRGFAGALFRGQWKS